MRAPVVSRVIQAVGLLGLVLVVLNAFTASAPVPDPSLERADVLGSILAVLLLLVGLLWERVEPLQPERVPLAGQEAFSLVEGLPEGLARELAWGSTMLLTATPAACVLVHWQGRTLLRRGLQPTEASPPFHPGPICERCLASGKAISLVDLRLYPGRDEFTPLLPGLPSVVVQPLAGEGLVLIGGWSPRCFSRSDLAWLEGWGRRLAEELTTGSVAVSGVALPPQGVLPPPAPGSG